ASLECYFRAAPYRTWFNFYEQALLGVGSILLRAKAEHCPAHRHRIGLTHRSDLAQPGQSCPGAHRSVWCPNVAPADCLLGTEDTDLFNRKMVAQPDQSRSN